MARKIPLSTGVWIASCSLLIGCIEYQYSLQDQIMQVCDQRQNEDTNGAGFQYEAIPLGVNPSGFAAKQVAGNTVVVIDNHVTITHATWEVQRHWFFIFHIIKSSRVFVELDPSANTPNIEAISAQVLARYPDASLSRPWMSDVRVGIQSPWLIGNINKPCNGFPIGAIPIEFSLTREETLRLQNLPADALVASGTISFYDRTSRGYYTRSFSLRKNSLSLAN